MSTHSLTGQQQAVVDAYAAGQDLVVEAGAGTGKTSTVRAAAGAKTDKAVYLAFNKAIAVEAQTSFPRHVGCSTAHSLAYRAVGHRYRHRLNGPHIPGQRVAQILRINEPYKLEQDMVLQPKQTARVALEMVAKFCHSADEQIHPGHLPKVTGAESADARRELAKFVVPYAERAWEDLQQERGELKFQHDHYLKLWALSGPRIEADVVFLDEAQDTNPVLADVVLCQRHAQRVLVGDQQQAIYGWRGATDAMAGFGGTRLQLSQSFRFGHAVAEEANKWLSLLGARLRLTGNPAIPSRVAPVDSPEAVLCRTNGAAVRELLALHDAGVPAALVGGGNEVKKLAKAALDLQDHRGTDHPELCMFTTWGQVQDYVQNDHGGSDLAVTVRLIDTHGPHRVIKAIDQAVAEDRAATIVSTAHKAKGREWNAVRVADDFPHPRDQHTGATTPPSRDEQMLAYVTVTRAQHTLDRSGLAWVDDLFTQPRPAQIA